MASNLTPQGLLGLTVVVVLHVAVIYGLLSHRLKVSSPAEQTLFVNFIAPPAPEKLTEPKRPLPPIPKPVDKPRARQLAAQAPVLKPADPVAPAQPDTPAPERAVQAPPMPLPAGPLALSSELAMVCPERPAPTYPPLSRRLGETGQVVLRVELSESGKVASAMVERSSGHPGLDQAALAAVRHWRCSPATRNGQPTGAVALQPFKFVLHES